MFKEFFSNVAKPLAVLEAERKQTMNELIEEIHRSFRSEGDRLLAEANLVLKRDIQDEVAVAARLKALGFVEVPRVKVADKAEEEQKMADELAKRIQHYNFYYPMHRFITEDGVSRLCAKYNLVCGEVTKYKGNVPMQNLSEIEAMPKVRVEDRQYFFESGISRSFRSFRNATLPPKALTYNDYMQYRAVQEEHMKARMRGSYYGYISFGGSPDRVWENSTMSICAPLKDFNTEGIELKGHQLTKIHVPDPVVLYPVQGGWLIVTAWGIEAGDESVANPNKN